jgi:DNA-binding transcriptional ArsR family regulator
MHVISIFVLPVAGHAGSPLPRIPLAQIPARLRMASRRLSGALVESLGFMWMTLPVATQLRFVYHKSVDVTPNTDAAVSAIAAAIGEPGRARMLFSLMDGHARTSTELAVVAGVTPSTASVHLHRLKHAHLVKVIVQGKHRFYSLDGPDVASALEGLSVLAGASRKKFVPTTPSRLRMARTCYDHMAGMVGVALHDRFRTLGWLSMGSTRNSTAYTVSLEGEKALTVLGIDLAATRALRRRFACPCLDWSERRPHVGGALGAALLNLALKRKWMIQELDSRALHVTALGRRELSSRFTIHT